MASPASAVPRQNFAELLTESDVREPDGRGGQPGELRESLASGNRQPGGTGNRRDDDETVKPTPATALAEDPGQADGGDLRSPLLANICLEALDRELERRGQAFCRYADDCNIYVGSPAAAERVRESIQGWIEKHLRLQVNAAKSGVGRTWERKFLGFRLNRAKQSEAAPESLER